MRLLNMHASVHACLWSPARRNAIERRWLEGGGTHEFDAKIKSGRKTVLSRTLAAPIDCMSEAGGRGPIRPPLRRWGGGASLEFP